VERVSGDVLDRSAVEQAVTGVDVVVHTAAFMSFRPADAARVLQVNVEGTRQVLRAAADRNIRVLYTSSIATVGLTAEPVALDETASGPASGGGLPYVESKLAAEALALAFAAQGADVAVLNPGILFGPADVHLTSTRSLLAYLRAPLLFYPAGGASLADVRDVAAAYLPALEQARAGQRYILAGLNVSYRDLLGRLARLSGRPAPLPLPTPVAGLWGLASQMAALVTPHPFDEFSPAVASYTGRFNFCRSDKARAAFGYRVPGDLDQLLRETVRDLLLRGLVPATTPELRALRVG
jgi:dihydroflavonol-4-reductase